MCFKPLTNDNFGSIVARNQLVWYHAIRDIGSSEEVFDSASSLAFYGHVGHSSSDTGFCRSGHCKEPRFDLEDNVDNVGFPVGSSVGTFDVDVGSQSGTREDLRCRLHSWPLSVFHFYRESHLDYDPD